MAWFRPARLFRKLTTRERSLAWHVFHHSLPPLNTIGVTDGLGDDGSIWTLDRSFLEFLQSGPPKSLDQLRYFLNFGEAVHWDLADEKPLQSAVPGYPDRARDVFVHEMTHVWQFHRGDSVKLRSIYAQKIGAGYKFTRGAPWKEYNVEQQAHIVETWNEERKDRGENDELFPYIHYIIRQEGQWKLSTGEYWSKTLAELQLMLDGERGFGTTTNDGPTQVTASDDSIVMVLSGDVLFDFDKAVVKPEAEPVLRQAAATIKARTTPRLRSIDINGYADSTGAAAYNEKLSERRAKAVADWFTSRSLLPAHLLKTQGFGEANPRVPNTTSQNRAKNRRVEIVMWNN
jgi:outer membrane protein OmpA-like peptidoglycan-associated protein